MNHPVTMHESEWTVHQGNFVSPEPVNRVEIGYGYGSILYTSCTCSHQPGSPSFKKQMKRLLAERLVGNLVPDPPAQWRDREDSSSQTFSLPDDCIGRPALPVREIGTVTIRHTELGCPELFLGANRGPSISFARSDGTVWAALSSGNLSVGIDVAKAAEFERSYPIHRAFNRSELLIGIQWTRGNLSEVAALLWSLKEAAVKALGCGFHLVDPLQVTVIPGRGQSLSNSFSVDLAVEAVKKLGLGRSPSFEIIVIREKGFWLAVALFGPE